MLNLKIVEILSGSALVTSLVFNAAGMEQQVAGGPQGQQRVCCEKQNGGAGAAQVATPADGWPVKMGGNHIETQAAPADGWPVKMGGNRSEAQAATPEDGWPVKMGGNRPEGLAVVTPTPVTDAPPAADARSVSEKGVAPTRNHRVLGLTPTQWGWVGGVLGAVALGAIITDDDDDRDRPVGPDGR
ncbi:MAG TPA: hypothetical protein VN018_10200 [Brevundimonas sp.]|nr:hypothetical protein [Brevundimonas sp.]